MEGLRVCVNMHACMYYIVEGSQCLNSTMINLNAHCAIERDYDLIVTHKTAAIKGRTTRSVQFIAVSGSPIIRNR